MKFNLPTIALVYDEAVAENSAREARAQRDHNIRAIRECLTASDVAAVVGETLQLTKSLTDLRGWLQQNDKPVLMLASLPGRGKTLACASWLADEGGLYVPCEDFLRMSTAKFGDELDRFVKLRGCKNLVLDDVGREPEQDIERMRAAVVELVDRRRGGTMRTVITTNLAATQFYKRYADDRLESRLTQSAVWRTDNGPDMRRGK